MEKKKSLLSIIIVVLLAFNSICLIRLKSEVESLRRRQSDNYANTQNVLTDLRHSINDVESTVNQKLEEQASLFSHTETKVYYREGELEVYAAVLPKSVAEDEAVIMTAKVLTADGSHTQLVESSRGADGSYGATFCLPPSAEVDVTVSMTGNGVTRQERLPVVYAIEALRLEGDCFWNEEVRGMEQMNTSLSVLLYDSERNRGLVDEIEYATLLLYKTNGAPMPENLTAANPNKALVLKEIDSADPAYPQDVIKHGLNQRVFTADLAEYFEENAEYELVLRLHTYGGMKYDCHAAGFKGTANNGSRHSGGLLLYPDFE